MNVLVVKFRMCVCVSAFFFILLLDQGHWTSVLVCVCQASLLHVLCFFVEKRSEIRVSSSVLHHFTLAFHFTYAWIECVWFAWSENCKLSWWQFKSIDNGYNDANALKKSVINGYLFVSPYDCCFRMHTTHMRTRSLSLSLSPPQCA